MVSRAEHTPLQCRLPLFFRVVAVTWALAACAPASLKIDAVQAEAAQAAREQILIAQTQWSLTGRVALSAGGQGGSGRIEWRQQGEDFDLRLTAPVTGKSWLLSRHGGRVRLEGLEGGPREGNDAEVLLFEATGWRIPVDSLRDWVRGARTGAEGRLDFDTEGRPTLLQQGGWAIEFRDWRPGDPPQPGRVYARQGDASVRLVIDAWGGQ